MEGGWKARPDCVPPLFHTVATTRLLAAIALHPDRNSTALSRFFGAHRPSVVRSLQRWGARGVVVQCARTKAYRLEWRQPSSRALRRLLLSLVHHDSVLRQDFAESARPGTKEWPPRVDPLSAPHDILGQPTRTAVLLLLAALSGSQEARLAELLCVERRHVHRILRDFAAIGFVSPRPWKSPRPLSIDGPSPIVPAFVAYLHALNKQVGIYLDMARI